jgi:hypothetical protein
MAMSGVATSVVGFATNITMACWVRPEHTNLQYIALLDSDFLGTNLISISVNNGFRLFIRGGFNDGSQDITYASGVCPTATWSHVAVTWYAATKSAALWINGVKIYHATNAAVTSGEMINGWIGCIVRPGTGVRLYPFNGCVDDVLITTSIMDIGALYTNTRPESYVADWHLPYVSAAAIYRMDCWTAPAATTRNKAVYLLQQMIGQ